MRGWTLQELLAPDFVTFYTQEWKEMGTKRSLKSIISSTTGIGPAYLVGSLSIFDASIAERMSWASRRVTSRTEDIAYCLLGLFGVNIPPLYGEGLNAFIRLQLEIIKTTDDETIFAWTSDTSEDAAFEGGLLARSPAAFRYSGNVRPSLFDPDRPPFQMTNKGLCMKVILFSPEHDAEDYMEDDHTIAVLNCSRNNSNDYLAILLRRVNGEQFVRIKPEALPAWNEGMGRKLGQEEVYIKQSRVQSKLNREDTCTLLLRVHPAGLKVLSSARDSRVGKWSMTDASWLMSLAENEVAEFSLEKRDDGQIYLAVRVEYPADDRWTDNILVVVNLSHKPLGANIATTIHKLGGFGGGSWVNRTNLAQELHRCSFDRLSRPLLYSGGSVSLTFKKGLSKDGRHGEPHYIVQITVDQTGLLLWPDPDEGVGTEQKSRGREPWIKAPSFSTESASRERSPGPDVNVLK